MLRSLRPAPLLLLSFLALGIAPPGQAQGVTTGFAEDFALSLDRAAMLDRLIPGTEDHYYYHCLERQHAGALEEVPAILAAWIQRHGRSARVEEIERRQALLGYGTDPEATWDYLTRTLGLTFDHEPQIRGARPDLPTSLDPQIIAPATLLRRALALHPGSLDGFNDSVLPLLLATDPDDRLLQKILDRLDRPDLPGVVSLVVKELDSRSSRGFGSCKIHERLLLDQLDECAAQRPVLLDDAQFIAAYLRRLRPDDDADPVSDAAVREAYLDRLEAFTRRLGSVQNSLKAHVLHHRLRHELEQGRFDRPRFVEYLRLPRQTRYVNQEFLKRHRNSSELVDPRRDFPTGFAVVGDDESLVRACFEHVFRDEDSVDAYATFVDKRWLERVLAETRILYGLGDRERMYSLLDDPAYYESLRDRVEIEFALSSERYLAPADPVTLQVDIKNVDTLLVKVYEIDALVYYREVGGEVDASIALDGLVASTETTHRYEESPFRRVRRTLEIPGLERPGVFVVELIGNGISSRAVIRKGQLRLRERLGAAGHAFRVLDETGALQLAASLYVGGRRFESDADGDIIVPYSTKPGEKTAVLVSGARTTLAHFEHRAESYRLDAAIHVDRESLLADQLARLVVRPSLRLNGSPVSLGILEEPVLQVRSTGADGTPSAMEIRGLELTSEQELVAEIKVPPGIRHLRVQLAGKVRSLSQDTDVELSSRQADFTLNSIQDTTLTSCPLLGRTEAGYVLDLRGLSGEPIAEHAIGLTLVHRGFRDRIEVQLRTDSVGRISLGALEGISSVTVQGLPAGHATWHLQTRGRTYPQRIHALQGQTVRVPYQGSATRSSRGIVSLFELRHGVVVRDLFERLRLESGSIQIRDLEPGDYELRLFEDQVTIPIAVTAGSAREGVILGRNRMLAVTPLASLGIAAMRVEGDDLVIRLDHAGPTARVHVVATRYLPPYDLLADLEGPRPATPATILLQHLDSIFESGRVISDEYRYILERRFAKKFPGNMLDRPGLLLNPWAQAETISSLGMGGGAGGAFGGRFGGARSRSARGGGGRASPGLEPGAFASLEFLPEASRMLANLVPDDEGVVRVPLADLGAGQLIHALAVDDHDAVYETQVRPEEELHPRDLRLATALDPKVHTAERRSIELVGSETTTTVSDRTTSRLKVHEDLASVFRLYQTLGGNELANFAFILEWPALSTERKNELYSEHACHELHFFLKEKDPEYFALVVRPYLANKAEKTFLDRYLLEEDLTSYLEPWAFGRLNIVERILLSRTLGDANGARHVEELLELVPPDPARMEQLFETTIAGDALAAAGDRLADAQRQEGGPAAEPATGLARPQGPPADRAALEEPSEDGVVEDAKAEGEAMDGEDDLDVAIAPSKSDIDKDVSERKKGRAHYRAPQQTKRYAEQNYWNQGIEENGPGSIPVNRFWYEFALSPEGAPFLSTHFPEASGSFSEMMFALAVLDLPFEAVDYTIATEGKRLSLKAGTPFLLAREELLEALPAEEAPPILVSEIFFPADDPYVFVGNERRDRRVTGEFLVGEPYGCRVVLTNPTSTPRQLEILVQVPAGAVPVKNGAETRGVPQRLDAYGTTAYEYAFYFPAPGEFTHYPAHASHEGRFVAAAAAETMKVVRKLSEVDTTSWDHVANNADTAQVIAFLEQANLRRLDLAELAWRMRDRAFFEQVIHLLAGRHAYDHTVWSYALLHHDEAAAREYLRHADAFLSGCGPYLDSPLAVIDPVERHAYQHIDYAPLWNPRAHPFGKRREILDQDFAAQFQALMQILGHRAELDDADWMSVTYYLLLQDRIEEALASFARVDSERLATRIQYDYMRAYLDFFSEDHAIARGIAERYRDHPVTRWRALFRNVLGQLDEAAGLAPTITDTDDRTQTQTEAAASEPTLELAVEARTIQLSYRNLTRVEIGLYEMDIEFLFSSNPFVQEGSGAATYVRPNQLLTVDLPAGQTTLNVDLPEAYRNSNLIVEARAAGLTLRQPYFANSLDLRMAENFGQLQVSEAGTGKPLPRVYVKVFARDPGGSVRFHKDGYTDLRGRFDYVSLSGPQGNTAERYAVLVLSAGDGAVVREVAAPLQ